jgi:hypothetical protein
MRKSGEPENCLLGSSAASRSSKVLKYEQGKRARRRRTGIKREKEPSVRVKRDALRASPSLLNDLNVEQDGLWLLCLSCA